MRVHAFRCAQTNGAERDREREREREGGRERALFFLVTESSSTSTSTIQPSVPHKMLSVALLCVCVCAVASARSDSGNFLDDKWLTGRWDKFRDEVEEPGTWSPSKPFDQGLDPAKDPCRKIKCGHHKVCVSEDYKTASCVSQRRVSFKDPSLDQSPEPKCKPCPVVHPSPVCGTDGHSYSTKCKLDYQACMTGKKIGVKCPGPCPCPAPLQTSSTDKTVCSELDLKEVVSRLKDWFRVLHQNTDHERVKKPEKSKLEVGVSPLCREPLGWMFSRLDTNFDLQLDQSEIKSLYLDRKEPCSDIFFQSCDVHADKVLTSSEWCSCFQRYTDSPCKAELASIRRKQAGKKLLGQYLPSCDEAGYYRSHQCHSSSNQCWCVDRYGNEIAGSRARGATNCGMILESSGDLGSGDSLFTDDDEDAFVLDEQATVDNEDDEDEDDDDINDEYLS